MKHSIVIVILLLINCGCNARSSGDRTTGKARAELPDIHLERQRSGTESLLVGVHAIDDLRAWTAGTGGTYASTEDGGLSWISGVVPGADSLQFRDVYAPSLEEAFLLSIGPGDASRVYHTNDRGGTWEMQFAATRDDAFFDCFAFWNEDAGLAFSDAVDGRFPMIVTTDGGALWSDLERTPDAQENEGGFAASGTCVVALGDETVLVGTGNASRARVLRSEDRGRTWQAYDVPIVSGEAAGIATLSFRDDLHGVALGGDIAHPEDDTTDNVAITSDGGRTWTAGGRTPFPGAVYGSGYAPDSGLLVAVGPGGVAVSHNDAKTWSQIDSLTHWSVDFGSPSSGWMVGPEGRVTRIAIVSD